MTDLICVLLTKSFDTTDMSKQTVLMREEEIDSLSYPALQRRCKELGLPARG